MVARMRTIQGAIEEIKATDPKSEFKEWALRQLVKSGKIRSVKVGSKYLVDIAVVLEYLHNPPLEEKEAVKYGQLRQVKA